MNPENRLIIFVGLHFTLIICSIAGPVANSDDNSVPGNMTKELSEKSELSKSAWNSKSTLPTFSKKLSIQTQGQSRMFVTGAGSTDIEEPRVKRQQCNPFANGQSWHRNLNGLMRGKRQSTSGCGCQQQQQSSCCCCQQPKPQPQPKCCCCPIKKPQPTCCCQSSCGGSSGRRQRRGLNWDDLNKLKQLFLATIGLSSNSNSDSNSNDCNCYPVRGRRLKRSPFNNGCSNQIPSFRTGWGKRSIGEAPVARGAGSRRKRQSSSCGCGCQQQQQSNCCQQPKQQCCCPQPKPQCCCQQQQQPRQQVCCCQQTTSSCCGSSGNGRKRSVTKRFTNWFSNRRNGNNNQNCIC